MKCAECKISRLKIMDKILKLKRNWMRVQAFGLRSGEYKGKFTFCSEQCQKEFFIKNNYTLD